MADESGGWNSCGRLRSHDMAFTTSGEIQLWLKLAFTLATCLIFVVNCKQYGPGNLLWFSDVALVTTVLALWFESSLLASMTAQSALLLDIIWNVDLLLGLFIGRSLTGIAGYMFDAKISRAIRAISLFHVVLPILLIWLLHRLGYDGRALVAQSLLAWIVLPLSYLLTDPADHVNWVFGFGGKPQRWMPPPLYVMLLMVLFPLLVYLPSHLILKRIF